MGGLETVALNRNCWETSSSRNTTHSTTARVNTLHSTQDARQAKMQYQHATRNTQQQGATRATTKPPNVALLNCCTVKLLGEYTARGGVCLSPSLSIHPLLRTGERPRRSLVAEVKSLGSCISTNRDEVLSLLDQEQRHFVPFKRAQPSITNTPACLLCCFVWYVMRCDTMLCDAVRCSAMGCDAVRSPFICIRCLLVVCALPACLIYVWRPIFTCALDPAASAANTDRPVLRRQGTP